MNKIFKNIDCLRKKAMPQIWFFKYLVEIDDLLIQNNNSIIRFSGLFINCSSSFISSSFKSLTFNTLTSSGKIGSSNLKIHSNEILNLTKLQIVKPEIKIDIKGQCVNILPCQLIAFSRDPLMKIIFWCGSVTIESSTFTNYNSDLILSFPSYVNINLIVEETEFESAIFQSKDKSFLFNVKNAKIAKTHIYFQQLTLDNSYDTLQLFMNEKNLLFQLDIDKFDVVCQINKFENIHLSANSFRLFNELISWKSCDLEFVSDYEMLSNFKFGITKIVNTDFPQLSSDNITFQLHQISNTKHLLHLLKFLNNFNSSKFSVQTKELNISTLTNDITFNVIEITASKIEENILSFIKNVPDWALAVKEKIQHFAMPI